MNDNKRQYGQEIKGHLLTGISWMIPLIVAAGICIALGQVIGGPDVGKHPGTIAWMLNQMGGWGMGLIVPLISAAIAYSIADRPGFAPGLIVGFICGQIGTGFIGGILGGFLVGYTVILLRRSIRLPQSMQGLMPIMVLPVLSTIIAGLLMMTFIGQPIVWLQKALIALLESMQGGSKFVMGAILGAMATFDFGGPVNKTMSLFADGMLVDGIYGPEAVKFVGSMIPPFGITLSWLLTRHKYTRAEKEALKAAFPMGICMITEGVIPIAARDLLRVVGSCVVASAVAGGLIMVWGVEAPVPHGGMFVVPLFTKPWLFCLALGIGTTICGVMLSLLKKPVTEADEEFDDVEDHSVGEDDIKFTLE
ncbi:PTS fructose transporter subunit IIC [Pantoea ananatis]|uniref:PTS fructose transporter subunit IIC n=1 Tax=Pantoea ananas TaxID=553 RepID=UPI0021E879C2|nr:PTS fructose transporter subunit IIC [Pantoea ananatis]MCW0309368.1 PTS system fructose-specific EIIB'BC component [Pantoea ananatis]MCW0339017.1 PTS system fructose-specific EIIB'BC component [Pantoea ananatis]MCW0359638.1 PTS system fructose-specific EIIB'BC component [Pantoea ananatis]MCW0364263.1 PTS system fructose-specific EIIB'BC component [Pantoea ananatis]MCW1776579.1 PTS fructose transporter subunit IIC [Pantoea ananatis]